VEKLGKNAVRAKTDANIPQQPFPNTLHITFHFMVKKIVANGI
jgi:hypothetical protein